MYDVTLIGSDIQDTTILFDSSSLGGALTTGIYLDSAHTHPITATKEGHAVFHDAAGHGKTSGDSITFYQSGAISHADWNFLLTGNFIIDVIDAYYFYIFFKLNSVKVSAYIFQPSLRDESTEIKYWGGGLRRVKKARLEFKLDIIPFKNRGYFTEEMGHQTYWELMRVVYKTNLFISQIGTDFERLQSGFLPSLFPNSFTLPIKVEVMDFGALTPIAEKNRDEVQITLCSNEWFTFS